MTEKGRFEPLARGRGRSMITTGPEWLHRVARRHSQRSWRADHIKRGFSWKGKSSAPFVAAMQSPNVPHPGPLPASQGERANGRTRHGSGLSGGWQPGEGEGGSGLRSLMPSSPYSPIYAHSSAHRMPRARICSLEYRESAQWGAAATKSRRGRRGPSAAERSPAA